MSEIVNESIETTEETIKETTPTQRYFYAELNENNVCKAILETDTSPKNIADCFVEIPSYDENYLFKIYNNGVWEEPEPIPEPVPQPTQLDRIEEAVNNIATNSTSWDVMAEAINEGVNEV